MKKANFFKEFSRFFKDIYAKSVLMDRIFCKIKLELLAEELQ
jgi:hypothetical protein